MDDGACSDPNVIADHRALQDDNSGGYVTVGPYPATRQHAERRDQASRSNVNGECGATSTADGSDDRPGKYQRFVGDDDGWPAALDDDPVVHIRARADLHVPDDRGG
jgi:hypothetical protein